MRNAVDGMTGAARLCISAGIAALCVAALAHAQSTVSSLDGGGMPRAEVADTLTNYAKKSDLAPVAATATSALPSADQANAVTAVLAAGPYTVQTGGSNPLSAIDTSKLPATAVVTVKDLGGCGANGTPGFGLVWWNGSGWRRISRGVQTKVSATSTITLDYWRDPMRISVDGGLTSAGAPVTPMRVLISNAPDGSLYSIVRPGVAATLTAFSINMAGAPATSDIAVVGPNSNLFEVVNSALSQVQAY